MDFCILKIPQSLSIAFTSTSKSKYKSGDVASCQNIGSRCSSSVATLRPAAVSRACKYVGSKATSSTNVLYEVSPSSS